MALLHSLKSMINSLKTPSSALAGYAAAIFLIFASIYRWPANFEDSFITYRYINALAATGGFDWNYDGNPVYGMTGLVFPLLSSAASFILRDPIISASLVGTAASILTLIIMSFKAGSSPVCWAVPMLLAANPIFVRGASNGLETSLAALFVTSIYLVEGLSQKWALAAVVTLSGFYIRPDLILICYTLFGLRFVLASRWKALSLYSAALGVLLLAGILSAFAYFGNPLPLSSAIKIDGIGLLAHPKWILSQYIVFPAIASAGVLVPVAALLIRGTKRNGIELTALILPLAIFLSYQITTLPIMNTGLRFATPIIAGLCASALIIGRKSLGLQWQYSRIAIATAIILTLCVTPAQVAASKESDHDNFATLGSAVSQISGLRIASSEAGKFAFYSIPSYFFDTIGLNSEFTASHFRDPKYFEMLRNYFYSRHEFPDLYVRYSGGIGAGAYAYLEGISDFERLYSCQVAKGLKICILDSSPRALKVSSKVEEWKSLK